MNALLVRASRVLVLCAALCAGFLVAAAPASAALDVTPITWDVVGLDSNRPLTSGPDLFPLGARVCSDIAATGVEVALVWDEPSAFIQTRPGSRDLLLFDFPAGECVDAYFELQVTRSAAAFGESRRYRVTADDGIDTAQSPTPREIHVESLVSQNRNSTMQIRWGQQSDQSDWVALGAGGGINLAVGQTYFIELTTQTSTAYEQLQSFLTLSNTIFQVLSVETTYTTLTAPPSRVPVPNPSLYADGCLWEPDPNSPNYLSCLASGKAGGQVVTVYQIDIVSGGGDSVGLEALIYDLSGGSFHYNTDFSQSPGDLVVFDPVMASFDKRFVPDSIGADGVATLRFTIGNPNPIAVSGYHFSDDLPGAMVVANPANASSTCGGTLAAVPGSGVIDFLDGALAPGATCTLLVDVTVPFDALASYPLVLDNVADLFVGDAVDPSDSAEASLEVTEEPPPPLQCTVLAPGTTLAQWATFDDAVSPTPTTEYAAGVASAGGGSGLIFDLNGVDEWRARAVVTGQTLAQARVGAAYYEFRLDTTGIDSVDFSLEAFRRNGNAPTSITLDYGPDGGSLVQSTTLSPLPTQANRPGTSNFAANGLTGLNPAGVTVFRVYAYGASNVNQPASVLNPLISGEGEVCVPVDPGTAPTPPSIAKVFVPAVVRAGEVSTLTFTLANPNAGDALTGVTFRDEMPAGMTAVGGFVNSGCGGSWGLEGGDPAVLLLSGGSLAANAACSLSVDVVSTTVGSNVNLSDPVDAVETLPGNMALDTLEVLPPPLAPSIAKHFTPNPLLDPAGSSLLQFQISNNDPSLDIDAVAFSDPLPAGMAPADDPIVFSDNGSCGAGYSFTYDSLSNTLSFTGGQILAGATCEIAIAVAVPGVDLSGGAVLFPNLTGAVSHVFEGITYEGNQAEATLLVDEPIPAIALAKQVGTGADPQGTWSDYLAVQAGTDVYYRLTIENIGETVLGNISVADPDVDAGSCPWTVPGFELPVADVGAPEAHIAVCVIGPVSAQAGSHVNTATATATGAGGVPVEDIDSATYATIGLSLAKSASPTTYDGAGENISFTFVISNDGAAVLSAPVTVDDPMVGAVACPALDTVGDFDNFFDPGEQVVCSATYVITAADVGDGSVTNVATAATPEAVSALDSATVTLNVPALSVSKVLTDQSSDPVVEGTTLTYTITASNDGNVPLTNVVVSDPILTPNQQTCPSVAVAGTCVLVGTYVVTAADVTAGEVSNTGGADSDETGPETDTVVTPVVGSPALSVAKALTAQSADPIVEGTTLTYTITASNDGNVPLTNVVVSDPILTPNQQACPSVPVAGTCALVGTYVVTAADVTAGEVSNTGGADSDETGPETDTVVTPVVGSPALSVLKSLTAQSDDPIVEGTTLTYTITATNDGNVPLANVVVSDPILTPNQQTCPSVAVSGTCVLVGTYVVTAADVTAGEISNTGGADSDETGPETDTLVTPVVGTPALSISKALTAQSADPIVEGTTLTYTITASNDGNVPLTNVVVSDPILTPNQQACPNVAVAGTCVLIGTYVVTAADVTAGEVSNTGGADSDETGPETDTVVTPVVGTPALSISKALTAQSADPIVEGTTLTYTITATNDGNVPLTNVVVSDPILTPNQQACPSVAVAGTCVLVGTYVVTAADVTTGEISNTGGADSDETGPETDTLVTPVVGSPALSVSKSLTAQSDDPIVEGTTLTYTITATNDGNVPLTNVVVSDPILTPNQQACPSVAVAGTCVLVGTYVVTAADVTTGEISNTGGANSDETGPETDTLVTPVVGSPALSVSKALTAQSDDPIVEGTTLTYTITATNDGNVPLTNVVVSDPILTPNQQTCPSVAVAGTCVLVGTYVVTAADVTTGEISNTGGADSDETGPETDTLVIPVVGTPALSISKALTAQDADPIVEGTTLTYTITATNDGNVALTNMVVSDPILSPNQQTCPSVAVSGTCVLVGTYVVTAADVTAGEISNTGGADSDETGPETDTLVTPVVGTPALSVSKALTAQSDDPIVEGTTLTYTITATNDGNVPLTNVVVSDPILTPNQQACPSVAVAGTCVLVGTYVVTAADVTTGEISNTGGADSDETGPETDTLVTPVVGSPALSVSKSLTAQSDDPIVEGTTLTYTITATNDGNVALTNVVVSDAILTPNQQTCPSVAVAGTCVLVGTYVVTAADVTTGEISNTGGADSDETGPETDTLVTPVVGTPALSISKALTAQSADPVVEGTTLTYTITATNDGNVPLTNVVVSDPILTPNQQTCPSVVVSGTCVLVGTYVVTEADVTAGQVSNTATADSDETGPETDTLVTPTAQAGPTPVLTVTKVLSSAPDPILVGSVLGYTVTAVNAGESMLSNVVVSDPMLTPQSITCAELDPTQTCILAGTYQVTAADVANGAIENTGVANSDQVGPVQDTVVTPLGADVWAEKVLVTPGPFSANQELSFVITVGNDGPLPATNVLLQDLPDNMTLTAVAPGAGVVCAGGVFPCTVPNLAVGATVQLTVTAILTTADDFSNRVDVAAAQPDPDMTNNADSTGSSANGGPPVAIPAPILVPGPGIPALVLLGLAFIGVGLRTSASRRRG